MNRLQLEALASSILIYLIIIVTIFSIALYSPNKEKSKTYVEKKSDVIEVSLGSPTKGKITKSSKNRSPKKTTKKEKRDKVVKKVRNITNKSIKKPIKKVTKKSAKKVKTKVVKKSSKPKKTVSKKVKNASSLFKKLPTNITDDTPTKQSNGSAGKSNKKVNKGRGVVNKYFAKIQSTLKGWPAQSNFAGERVKVELTIYSTGLFDYRVLSRSLNPEFNRSLKAYLEQLKKFGFGPHSNPKPYKIIVEFIARG